MDGTCRRRWPLSSGLPLPPARAAPCVRGQLDAPHRQDTHDRGVNHLMLRVAEQYAVTDPGRQRRANEDSLLVRSPLFVVADGMGGAQAGEVASRVAVEAFHEGLSDSSDAERS